jgi:formaldehyde-activating enzyme involved in methanogenesis
LPKAELAGQPLTNLTGATDEMVLEVLNEDEAVATAEAAEDAIVGDAVANSESVVASAAQVVVIPSSVPGVKASPRPLVRPAALIRRASATRDAVAEAVAEAVAGGVAPLEVEADTLPVGSRLVQLGAFESEDLARAEWEELAERFSDVMDGKPRVIQAAASGGKTFYRLRVAGFDDLADARRFCATLVADKSKPLGVPVATR